jgi:hypothetical protein
LSKRIYSESLINDFRLALRDTNWDDVITSATVCNDVSTAYALFNARFVQLFENYFPLKSSNYSKRSTPHHEWITKGLIKSCHKKSLLYKRFKINSDPLAKEKYIKYRNKLKIILQKAKKEYYQSKFNRAAGNLCHTWKLINNILDKNKSENFVANFVKDGIIINSPKNIVDNFNEYFVNIGSNLASKIPPATNHFTSYMKKSPLNSFSLFFTDAYEVVNTVNDISKKSSFGYDNVPVDIMKVCIEPIAKPLAALINCSFRSGTFPDQLKIAKICPIFKNGSGKQFLRLQTYLGPDKFFKGF